jgi:DNA-cytosine methyltransferase
MHESSFNNFLSDGKNGFSEAEGITVLSLFDGMSCGQLALQKLGIKVKQYYAAEIDKHAIQVTQHNFPNTIQLGDVTKVFGKDLPRIDLLIGGSPCQGFSFAGKQLAFDDPRSKLFFEFVRLKNECNPTYFMLENVKMKKEFELIISKYMGVTPIEINSALLSAQNRVRLYWTNIANEPFGLFGDMQCTIPQPKDKNILLRDVLEKDVAEKFYLSEKMLKWLTRHSEKRGTEFKQLDGNQKASCLTTTEAKQNLSNDYILEACIKFGRTDEAKEIRKESMRNGKDYTPHAKKEITGLDFEKMNTLTTASNKDNLVMQLNTSTESGGKQPYQQNRIYDTDGISPALMAQMSCGTHAILEKSPCLHGFEHGTNGQLNKQLAKGGLIRRLTETECERLQTVPDGYTGIVSSTQRYRMLGNGWTVDVIAYIFSFMALKKPKSDGEKIIKTA